MKIQKLAKRCLLHLSNNGLASQINSRKISSVDDRDSMAGRIVNWPSLFGKLFDITL